jgi:hypothetical protein
MKKFFLFALLVTALFIWLNRNDSSKPATPPPQSQSVHWPKNSIDRARSVTEQARRNTAESQQP